MAVSREQHRLMYKIAQAYYLENATQDQIGIRFGLSRIKVSRLLKRARQSKIVNIQLTPPANALTDLERALEVKYGLEEVCIVACDDPDDPAGLARQLGPAAAECLIRRLTGSEIVGVTWGTTVMAVIDAVPVLAWPDVTVVQMSGGLGPVGELEHSTRLASRMAEKLGARVALLPAPGIISDRRNVRAFRSDRGISQVLDLAARSSYALVGIGVPSPDSFLMRDGSILSPADLAELRRAGSVGDIALRFIDAQGRPVDLEINERIIGLTFEQLRAIRCVIAVAGGTAKFEAIRAALKTGIPDVLVTDAHTGRFLNG